MLRRKAISRAVSIFVGLLSAPLLFGAENNLDVLIGADIAHHSNAALEGEDPESDLDRVARAAASFEREDAILPVQLRYQVERHDFQDGVQEDRTSVDGASNLTWKMLPQLLDLNLSHQISDQLRDRREANVNENRERRSILSADLDGYLRPSKVDTIVISPRFTDVKLQGSSSSDSQHAAIDLSWVHALSQVSRLELTGSKEEVRFDEEEDDYDASRAQLGFGSKLSRFDYYVAGGVNRIERDDRDDVDGFSGQIRADYVETAYSWGAVAIRQLTDSSIGLSSFQSASSEFRASDGNIDTVDIVESSQVDIHGQYRLDNSSKVSGKVGYVQQDYEDTPRDEDSWHVQVGYEYTVNTRWNVGISSRYGRTDFVDDPLGLEYRDTHHTAFAALKNSQRLQTRITVGHEDRDANISARSYTDNYVVVGVTYNLL